MAGAKGRSGGPRANAGGARAGAGRKPKAEKKSANGQAHPVASDTDMLTLLQQIALGQIPASNIQVRAAIAAVQYTHVKKGDGGKKDERKEAAGKVGGRFSAPPPPLKVVGGK